MKYRFYLLLSVAFCLSACAIFNPVAESLGSLGNVDIVRHPDKVDACILQFSLTKDRRVHYEETDYIVVPPDLAAAMQAALLSKATYDRKINKFCAPQYIARLRFHQGKKTLAVDFCFRCMIMGISRDGVQIGQEDFWSGVFLTSLSQLFPNEPALPKIKVRGKPRAP